MSAVWSASQVRLVKDDDDDEVDEEAHSPGVVDCLSGVRAALCDRIRVFVQSGAAPPIATTTMTTTTAAADDFADAASDEEDEDEAESVVAAPAVAVAASTPCALLFASVFLCFCY